MHLVDDGEGLNQMHENSTPDLLLAMDCMNSSITQGNRAATLMAVLAGL